MTERIRTALVLLVPIVAVLCVVMGLRLGARGAVRAADVYVSAPAPESEAFYLEVLVSSDDRGVKEPAVLRGLQVTVDQCGTRTDATVDTTSHGVAVVRVPWQATDHGAACARRITLRHPEEASPLADGVIALPPPASPAVPADGLRPTKRDGALRIELFAPEGKLPVDAEGELWVRISKDGVPQSASLEIESEDVEAPKGTLVTCTNGFAMIPVKPRFPIAGVSLHAHAEQGVFGDWFGPLPTLPGATRARLESDSTLVLHPAGPRPALYGKVFGAHGLLDAFVVVPAGDGDVRVPAPALGDDRVLWLAVSSDPFVTLSPEGEAHVSRSALASSALRVGRKAAPMPCLFGPRLVAEGGTPVPRSVRVLEGLSTRRAVDDARRAKGWLVALGGLLGGAFAEILLLVLGARRAARDLAAFEAAAADMNGDADAGVDLGSGPAGRRELFLQLAFGIAFALLAFSFLAALLLLKIQV